MKKYLLWGLAALVLLGAVGYWFGFWGHQQQAPQGPYAVQVSAYVAQVQSIERKKELPGRTSAFRVAEIRPQVNGIIMKRLFEEGSFVKEGMQLYQIDAAPYQAAYNSAKADLLSAQANVKSVQSRAERYEHLVKIDAVSQQEYDDIRAQHDQARAAVAMAQAALDVAKVNLDYTKVYAPISGRIGKSFVTEGALVTANQAQILSMITQLDPMYVDMTQSSTELTEMRLNQNGGAQQKVTLKQEGALVGYNDIGTLQFSDITIDQTTGSVQLRALFPNPKEELLPGLFVRAEIHLGQEPVVMIPQQSAIRNANGGLTAWVVDASNTVNPRPIQVREAHDNFWIVTSGLNAGEMVVVEGFQKIQPGAQVQPVAWQPKGENKAPSNAAAPEKKAD